MQTNIEKNVMRRVRLIRLFALVISTAMLAVLTFIAALWGVGREVWVERVFENTPTDFTQILSFYFAAFLNTSFLVQVLSVLTFVSFVYLTREVVRLVLSIFMTKQV